MNILIVDDHPMVRKGLVSMLSFEKDIELIIEASNIEEAINGLTQRKIDFAIIDLKLGVEDGLEIVRRVKEKNINTKLIILTSSMKREDFIRAKEYGVEGYILKQAFAEDIIYAMHVVMRNRKYYDPEIMEYSNMNEDDGFKDLTPREIEVAKALGEGLDNGGIARKLFISQNTVKKHVSNIMAKLEFEHRTQVAIYVNKYADR